MTRFVRGVFILICFIGLAGVYPSQRGSAQTLATTVQQTSTQQADLELAQRYVPVLYFHPDEIYHPMAVSAMLSLTRMRQNVRLWLDPTIVNSPTLQDLLAIPTNGTYFLDQWFGDTGSSEYGNPYSHRLIYETSLSPHSGGPDPVTYVHVVRNEDSDHITIQYWLFYFYNNWFNKHEGDWEFVQVILQDDGQPESVIYSQHNGAIRRTWENAPLEGGSHPVVYVARGSHANYFAGNEVYPHDKLIGNQRIVLVDRTGISERMVPDIILIPTRQELEANPQGWPGAEWLNFRGRWGETGIYGDFNGPLGPADKGDQWDKPYAWGSELPLDEESWYKNRLKVALFGPAQAKAHVQLTDQTGEIIPQGESLDDLAILHINPLEQVLAQIDGTPGAHYTMTISWPDPLSQIVTTTSFSGFDLDTSGHAQLELSPGHATFLSALNQLSLQPSLLGTFKPVWDGPDTVLVIPLLSFTQILSGLGIAIAISIVPILVLIGILYWVDRYQKEPLRMLALAFAWGALPALVIAILVQVFFKLPPDMLGVNALQAIRLGLLAPVLEEVLKGAGVLYIYWRRPREVNDVLDGMIYGAIVGFGFAFLSNLFRYAGNFMVLGFPALNVDLITERTVHALDHGLYTAIFGAGLGFAISAKDRRQFWVRVIAGLVLAIAVHALHNLLANSTVGLNLFSVIVTTLGTLVLWVVAGWSMVKQRQLLRAELQGLVHDSLYLSVQGPLARLKAQWHVLRREGFRAWIQVRRLQGLCIKLANARLQARLFPERIRHQAEAESLQAEIKKIYERRRLATR